MVLNVRRILLTFTLALPIVALETENSPFDYDGRTISDLSVEGAKLVSDRTVIQRFGLASGMRYSHDEVKEGIRRICQTLPVESVDVFVKEDGNDLRVKLEVRERSPLERIEFHGNKGISSDALLKELEFQKATGVNEEVAAAAAEQLQLIYRRKGYKDATVDYKLVREPGTKSYVLKLYVNEGKRSLVRKIEFVGNRAIDDARLRAFLVTREWWILSMGDGSGELSREMLEIDKERIRYLYYEKGYLKATVTDVRTEEERPGFIKVTFVIEEGDPYIVSFVDTVGFSDLPEREVKRAIKVKRGDVYNHRLVLETLKRLKSLWSERGFSDSDVYPQIKEDDVTRTVSVVFRGRRGVKLIIRNIEIFGNTRTKENVIRRELLVKEGDVLNEVLLERSKRNLEYLGYFERGSIYWKIRRLKNRYVDLELYVKEGQTIRTLNLMLTYSTWAGSRKATTSIAMEANVKNFMGNGWDASARVTGEFNRFRNLSFSFLNPRVNDSMWALGGSVYMVHEYYDAWAAMLRPPSEKIVGGSLTVQRKFPRGDYFIRSGSILGVESIENNDPTALPQYDALIRPVAEAMFRNGKQLWFDTDLVFDSRNHAIFPTRGGALGVRVKAAPNISDDAFSYTKVEAFGSWYTPIIGEDKLVLSARLRTGSLFAFGNLGSPYRELYHVGGPNSVRGFKWGELSPRWITGHPIGAKHFLQGNVELVFPLVETGQIRGHLFYDFGTGWGIPDQLELDRQYVIGDRFDIRHSVGFGFKVTMPVTVQLDWGYKLAPRPGETKREFHLSMITPW